MLWMSSEPEGPDARQVAHQHAARQPPGGHAPLLDPEGARAAPPRRAGRLDAGLTPAAGAGGLRGGGRLRPSPAPRSHASVAEPEGSGIGGSISPLSRNVARNRPTRRGDTRPDPPPPSPAPDHAATRHEPSGR